LRKNHRDFADEFLPIDFHYLEFFRKLEEKIVSVKTTSSINNYTPDKKTAIMKNF